MPARGPRVPNDGGGNHPATDVIVESSAHDLDFREFRHCP